MFNDFNKKEAVHVYVPPQVYGRNGLHNVTNTARFLNISGTLALVCSGLGRPFAKNVCRNPCSAPSPCREG